MRCADVPPLDLEPLLADVDAVVAMGDSCFAEDDRLLGRLGELAGWAHELRASGDDDARLELLGRAPKLRRRDDRPEGQLARLVARCVTAYRALGTATRCVRDAIQQACLQRLAGCWPAFTVGAADERRRAGELEFHDLLVLARAVLRDPDPRCAVRAAAAPALSAAAARRVPGHRPDPDRAGRAASPSSDRPGEPATSLVRSVDVEPGRLFFVGDPKQSIYRFRRADIAMFLRARDALRRARSSSSTTNFRTVAPILEWVNHMFGRAHAARAPAELPQPAVPRARPVRPAPPAARPVAVRRAGCPPAGRRGADELREAEAEDVAAAIAAGDRRAAGPSATRRRTDVAPGAARRHRHPAAGPHVAAVTSSDALEPPSVPYRAETARWSTAPRRSATCSMVARAPSTTRPTSSPRGRPALAALRLLRRRPVPVASSAPAAAGTTSARPARRPPADHPVGRGLALPRASCTASGWWLSPARLLDGSLRDRRLLRARLRRAPPARGVAAAAVRRRPGPGLEEAGGGTLRQYLALGRAARRRGRPGRRDGAARDRRRRRADHDDPRRQGPGVPDHHRRRA